MSGCEGKKNISLRYTTLLTELVNRNSQEQVHPGEGNVEIWRYDRESEQKRVAVKTKGQER